MSGTHMIGAALLPCDLCERCGPGVCDPGVSWDPDPASVCSGEAEGQGEWCSCPCKRVALALPSVAVPLTFPGRPFPAERILFWFEEDWFVWGAARGTCLLEVPRHMPHWSHTWSLLVSWGVLLMASSVGLLLVGPLGEVGGTLTRGPEE